MHQGLINRLLFLSGNMMMQQIKGEKESGNKIWERCGY
jgi:hypothetical protein